MIHHVYQIYIYIIDIYIIYMSLCSTELYDEGVIIASLSNSHTHSLTVSVSMFPGSYVPLFV